MGGRGSGRIGGRRGAVCEDYLAIDLALIRAKSGLRPGWVGQLTWTRNGSVTGTVNYRVEPDGLRLQYRTRATGSEWRSVDELVPFNLTAMRFGGTRRWLICLSCRRRCRILYGGAR